MLDRVFPLYKLLSFWLRDFRPLHQTVLLTVKLIHYGWQVPIATVKVPGTNFWAELKEYLTEMHATSSNSKPFMNINRVYRFPLCPDCRKPKGIQCMICKSEEHIQRQTHLDSNIKDEVEVVTRKGQTSTSAEGDAILNNGRKQGVIQSAQQLSSSSPLAKQPDTAEDMGMEFAAIKSTVDATTNKSGHPRMMDLLFRCQTCLRAAHYACLSQSISTWQVANNWQCVSCTSWGTPDAVLAWRPMTNESTASKDLIVNFSSPSKRLVPPANLPSYKDPSENAEYLVKFKEQSFRQVEWVPHAWLRATYPARLRGFLTKGPSIDISPETGEEVDDQDHLESFGLAPNPDGISKIPKEWLTPDRVLEVEYYPKKGNDLIPSANLKSLGADPVDSIDRIARLYIKWQGLPYESGMSDDLSSRFSTESMQSDLATWPSRVDRSTI